MTINFKKRLEGTKAQDNAQARAFALAVIANRILAAKRAAKE